MGNITNPPTETVRATGDVTLDASMPVSGIFGQGRSTLITSTGTFLAKATTMRVRCFGPGGPGNAGSAGGGGGFAMKVLTGLTVGTSYVVTLSSSITSFGVLLSASAGVTQSAGGQGGTGTNGDVNNTGGAAGSGVSGGGGGAGNLISTGGAGAPGGGLGGSGKSSSSGGGGGDGTSSISGTPGGFGFAPTGFFSIDFIGCGSGSGGPSTTIASVPQPAGMTPANAGNGGGGGARSAGSFPGGGSGDSGGPGGGGLIVVEW